MAGALPHRFQRGLMGTVFTVECYTHDRSVALKAVEEAFAEAAAINAVASDYIADSELLSFSRVAPGTGIRVSDRLFPLLWEAYELAVRTGGRFDPTLGPLTKLWRETRRRQVLPDAEALDAALAASGWRHLVLDEKAQTLEFKRRGMRLDLGGIAKGQAADAMLEILRRHGISRSSISAGGDIRVGDAPLDAEGWRVDVLVSERSQNPDPIYLANAAVSTSGDLHQFVEIAGKRYSHIIDPATGLGLTRRVSATVVAPTATLSDALATACCVADPAEATALAARWGALELRLVTEEG